MAAERGGGGGMGVEIAWDDAASSPSHHLGDEISVCSGVDGMNHACIHRLVWRKFVHFAFVQRFFSPANM